MVHWKRNIHNKLQYLKRKPRINLSWFQLCWSSLLVELEFGDVGFCGGSITGVPKENHWSKRRTNNKFNQHMAPGGIELRPN